jgi:hypothetical protein
MKTFKFKICVKVILAQKLQKAAEFIQPLNGCSDWLS